MQTEVIKNEEEPVSETTTEEPVAGDVSQSEGSESTTENEVVDYESHLTLIEQQLTGCICFMGVLLGAYLMKALFERFKT